ncbi:hypothetical protein Fmac_026743 [Flemingia macrophylla]|uniref:Uncharacterized protein n=1 Tax=Flemingia macrophylla TaxID=520843 RepID=A0ABD1LFQ8_9FABA
MMQRQSLSKNKAKYDDYGFTDLILSWSIGDILNSELYKNKVSSGTISVCYLMLRVTELFVIVVKKIELSFQSIDHYCGSFKYPLLEETRAQFCSSIEIIDQAPYAEVIAIQEAKPYENKLYNLKIDSWESRFAHILILADYKPEAVKDLLSSGRFWSFVSAVWTTEEECDSISACLKIKASENIDMENLRNKTLFLIFLTNVNSNKRIWGALHMPGNLKLLRKILCNRHEVEECCSCSCSSPVGALRYDRSYQRLLSELNQSQNNAISSCLSGLNCNHNSVVKLIWGPPGTGKTRTLAILLFALMKMNYRVLVCAPTNVAIKEVATRVVNILKEVHSIESGDLLCSLGDLLLFGNNEKLRIEDIEDVYLDHRVEQLKKCFSPYTGFGHCLKSMIDLLENCVSDYHIYKLKEDEKLKPKSFLAFLREGFGSAASKLESCISILCTHVAMSHLLKHKYRNLICLNKTLKSFQDLLFQNIFSSEGLEELFSCKTLPWMTSWSFGGAEKQLYKKRTECLTYLMALKCSVDEIMMINSSNKEDSIREFCFQTSSLIFCTASGSHKLHNLAINPLDILVIDEAAMLKDCESIIPILLPGISHAILVGDERQLPSMVRSNVSNEAGFGRSLFQRLSSLGYKKFLLNMQHRMHPQISSFPNSYFYSNKIQNAPNVERTDYLKQYLPEPMFGPYSFINIIGGKEQFDDEGRSFRNMAEVAVIMTILKNLHKAWLTSKQKLSIGIVSPYAGQVVAIDKKLGKIFESHDGFKVNVKSVDGFQGGEHDVIILSTVRTNNRTFLEFISSPQRTNVALTRARHCLWILGNERALTNKENVWKAIVLDAKKRNCFFDAERDEEMAKAILDAKKERDQFDDLLDTNSYLFKDQLWKVHFSEKFRRSFKRLRSYEIKKKVLNLLGRLSSGWRPKMITVDLCCENSSQILKQFKVESYYIICSIEIVKTSRYIQVLKIWDILPVEDIPQLAKRLDYVFKRYTNDYIIKCKEKGRYSDGNVEFPLSWPLSANIPMFKNVDKEANEGDTDENTSDAENYKVEECILLMKYCSISRGSLLYGQDSLEVDLPYEVTDDQRNIILYPQSTFVLGRSGTGKTTVLITKLIQNEKLYHTAVEQVYGSKIYVNPEEYKEIASETEKPVLRQLFVTLNSGLCQKVQHHVSLWKRSLCEGTTISDSTDISTQFKNIPDSFDDLPHDLYPLVITFRKFLLMLDATLGNSYFERFYRNVKDIGSGSGSGALETFIIRKEVTYERFDSSYWPHFNVQICKKLDSYLVFTEIMSHIKGGTRKLEHGKISREDYCALSESRASSLNIETRNMIYDIFQNYEKMKMRYGDFDFADFVIDIHSRLMNQRYKGDQMHYVYIDEVQDLTMAQIALFKHVCRNVEEGFVFCGDTAQTVGRGIDFRIQDVRSLFYKKFVLESKRWTQDNRKDKGQISDIYVLNKLKVETSLVHGKLPVVVKARYLENSVLTTFVSTEKVILVRDNSARDEVLRIVGKKAHVLTFLECKGLEFQDVLLYNFFASSPLQRWGVIYDYMKEHHMLDSRIHTNFLRCFDQDSRHNVLCSELKNLYVALTRARRRLWIYEDAEEISKPMFDYWQKKNLVQFQ